MSSDESGEEQPERAAPSEFDLRVFEPEEIRLFRSPAGDARVRVTVGNERSWYSVQVARAFPFSDPGGYVGLRDDNDGELGLIPDIRKLDNESRAVIEEELHRRYFTPRVLSVTTAVELTGTVTFVVQTDRGERRFIVRNLRDSSFLLGPDRLMLVDVDGNRYEFPNVSTLGQTAYRILSKVI